MRCPACFRCLAIATLLAAGCASHADRLRQVRTDFYNGNLTAARMTVETLLEHVGVTDDAPQVPAADHAEEGDH